MNRVLSRRLKPLYKIASTLNERFGLLRFAPFRKLERMVRKRFRISIVEVNGYRMILDDDDSLRLSITGDYAPEETDLAKSLIKEGSTVLDIGAHIGYFTLLFSNLVGETGKVIAFEPDPKNFALLEKNIELNKMSNVVAVQKAVGNENGQVKLFLSSENSRYHNIFNWDKDAASVQVDVVRLDDFVLKELNVSSVDFIKMDIQGAEADAIRGMSGLIRQSARVALLTEFAPSFLKGAGIGPRGYYDLLTSQGFAVFQPGNPLIEITEKDLPDLARVYYTNLLCLKNTGMGGPSGARQKDAT